MTETETASDTVSVLQLSFNKLRPRKPAKGKTLADLLEGEHGILEALHLPEEMSRRLMELGFLPGHKVSAAKSAPGGDPRVFQVDGSEVALRRETARLLTIRFAGE